MNRLSPVFTDPSKVKVLHGADSDILWLQRDFGLHIVNMFDTGQASRVLGLPRFSLAYLYKQYWSAERVFPPQSSDRDWNFECPSNVLQQCGRGQAVPARGLAH